MGEVVRFVSKADRERVRLIQEARAIYDSIFPASEKPNKEPASQMVRAANARHGDGFRLP